MGIETLRCRVCGEETSARAVGVCASCFGPLEPVYDWERVAATVSRQSISAGPRSIWRYGALLPAEAPPDAAYGPGMTPLVPAPRLAQALGLGEVWLKLD